MMKKKVKKGSALVLALMLMLSAVPLLKVQAATAVDTTKTGSIGFSIAADFSDLSDARYPVTIDLYKVASIDASGTYTAEGAFEDLDVAYVENGDSKAWGDRAEAAAGMAEGVSPDVTVQTENGEATASDLPLGLYLVYPQQMQSPLYTYTFTPYLISVPNNYYYTSTEGDDTWIYDLTGTNALELKVEQTRRLGSLQIDKQLVSHSTTMGDDASFVFQVDIPEYGDTPAVTKYVELTFDAIGTKHSLIEDIPAGLTVTVTEVYTGAGYQLVAGATDRYQPEIVADSTATVTFVNEHDGTITGGYGVVNHFVQNDAGTDYDWTQLVDNAFEAN
ncbi:MAG: DUF5979 domain-containing protein [Lachnospiraceae bacterium]|nr:DUF5979 domain-containing protein [Lachnospiraceae bacterium]